MRVCHVHLCQLKNQTCHKEESIFGSKRTRKTRHANTDLLDKAADVLDKMLCHSYSKAACHAARVFQRVKLAQYVIAH